MEALVQALGRFATRDIPYIVGGLSTILAFSLAMEVPIPEDPATPLLFFMIAISHPIGYAVQSAISLTPLVTTSSVVQPQDVLVWCYKRWTKMSWKMPAEFDAHSAYYGMYGMLQDKIAPIERVIFLKHVGTAVGTNWLLCSFLLAFSGIRSCNSKMFVLAGAALLLASFLILFGWLQAMEQCLALSRIEQLKASTSNRVGSNRAEELKINSDLQR